MTNRFAFRVFAALAVLGVTLTGCHASNGKPAASTSSSADVSTTATRSSVVSSTSVTKTASPSTPAGQPIGTATLKVDGAGPVTIRYQINGAPEQTETGVALPWQKEYPVYDEISTSVTADAGDASLTCSIVMDGKLAAFKTEPRPSCSFAYYG